MRTWLYVLHALQVLLLIGLAWAVATMRRPAPPTPPAPPPVTATLDAEIRGALIELAGRLSDVEASCVWLPRSERLRVAVVPPTRVSAGGR